MCILLALVSYYDDIEGKTNTYEVLPQEHLTPMADKSIITQIYMIFDYCYYSCDMPRLSVVPSYTLISVAHVLYTPGLVLWSCPDML